MQANLLSRLDVLIIVIYFAVIAWLGFRFAANQNSTETYFASKRKFPGWMVGLSMFAATLSCVTFIGFPGWTYRHGIAIIMREYMAIFAVIIAAVFVIPVFRAVVKMSVFEYLEHRYGLLVRLYNSIGIIVTAPVGLGILLYILCLALNGLTGIPMLWLILAIGVITLVYTAWGGIEGCIYTEAIHGAMFIGTGILTLIFLLFFSTQGGASEIVQMANTGNKFDLIDPTFSLTTPTVYVFVWMGLFHFTNNYTAAPYMVQRYIVAPSSREAARSAILSVVCCVVTWAVFMSIGCLLWAFYQINPGAIPANIEPDKIFPHFMGTQLPTGLAGLILAGLLASGLSGISSALNSTSACIQSDIYDRLVKNPDPKQRLFISHASVLSMGLLSMVVAFLLTFWEAGVVQFGADVINSIMGPILGGGSLAIFFLGIFTRRTSKRGMYVGLACGILFSTWAILTNADNPIGKMTAATVSQIMPSFPWHIWLLFGLSNLIVAATAYIASLILDPGKLAPVELTVYGMRARNAHAEAQAAAQNSPEPKRVLVGSNSQS